MKDCVWHLEVCNESYGTTVPCYVGLAFAVLSYSNRCIVVLTCVFRQEMIISHFMLVRDLNFLTPKSNHPK